MPKYTYGVAGYDAVVCNLKYKGKYLKPGHLTHHLIYKVLGYGLHDAPFWVLPHTTGEQKNKFTVSALTLDELTTALDRIRGAFGG